MRRSRGPNASYQNSTPLAARPHIRRESCIKLKHMSLTYVLLFAAAFALFLLLKRIGLVSAKHARACLASGALIIDVRTPAEFANSHLPSAINLPLDQIETALPRRVKNKSQALLLHCHSGMRCAVAKKKLAALGYLNAFNLGSYSRAARIARTQ